MKRCPTCHRTFNDDMRFCQHDGTTLVADAPASASDPFKTRIGSTIDNLEPEFDPMKTMAAPPPKVDAPPPSPFSPPAAGSSPDLNAPSFGSTAPPSFSEDLLRDSSQPGNSSSGGFGSSSAPSSSPTTFQEPASFNSSPVFGQSEPLGAASNQWSPPPVPSGWGDQGLGQNTPFAQTPVAVQSQNQTLAIVSLVLGILGVLCCGLFTGIPALVTGYMAKNNAQQNPTQYGGRGFALAGMILGGISVITTILSIIYYIAVGLGSR